MPHEDASSHRPSNADKQHALRSGRTTRWWHQSTVIETCAAQMHVGNAQSTHDEPSSRRPEWPRGSRDATPCRAHPPFSSTYISALCKPLTYARTSALWQHPRTTQWDRVTRRQEITFTEYGLSERSSLTRGTKYIYMSTAVPFDRAGTAGFRGWDLLLP